MSSSQQSADHPATDPTADGRLSGRMGVLELIFTVVAYNGPVVVFLGFIPIAILLGNGAGTPAVILAAGLVVSMLAVGLLKMSGRLDKPGGFYALITAGLGRPAGLGAGFAALTCYFVALVSVYSLSGISLNAMVNGLFNGPDISWKIWALVVLVIASVLGYFNISFSAKILTVFLLLELVLMMAYDISVLVQGGGPEGLGLDSFTPDQIFSGSVPIAFLFAVGLFGGFEATVIFRDEVKNPHRSIPRATYGVIALLAGAYALTAWCFINAYGASQIVGVVATDPVGASTASIREYTGEFAYDMATIMLFTSAFALVLAAHNITSRYLFNLGADGIFPRQLGVAHPRHASPHRASTVVSFAALLVLVLFIVAGVSSSTLYGRLAGMYSYTFMMLLVLVAISIGVFLLRDQANGSAVGPAVAALLASVVLCWSLALGTKNFDLLTGATGGSKAVLLTVIWGVALGGFAWALVLRRKAPGTYQNIGRSDV